MKRALPYILIPLAALFAVLPLILHGCSCGHDFDFHLVSWLEAASQFSHGNLHPAWTTTPAWNAGEPRFVFYPPLSWTLGGILGLLMPWTWTPIGYTWLALTAAGLSLHRLARDFTTPSAAILAAIVYLANPYTLFTAYERTAYAELLAAAILPLLLHAILKPKVTIPGIAIPIALLWLTNAPAAVIGCYTLALLTLIRLIQQNRHPERSAAQSKDPEEAHLTTSSSFFPPQASSPVQLALKSTAGTLLGLGLAAFYILPAAYERRYVQIAMATLPGMAISDNFLFHHTGLTPDDLDHDAVLHTASLIAIILLALTAISIVLIFVQANKDRVPHSSQSHRDEWECKTSTSASFKNILLPITLLTAIIAFLLTPISAPIWHHAPELLFLQFPWRFLAVQAPLMALAIAIALRNINLKPSLTIAFGLIAAAALIYSAYTTFAQGCDTPDTVQAHVALFRSTNPGTDPTDEYTPIAADNDSISHANPPYWLAADPNAPAPTNTQPGTTPAHLTLTTPQPQTLILNLRDYPAWQVSSGCEHCRFFNIFPHIHRRDGLIAIALPAGTSSIDITRRILPDQSWGAALSLIALILLTLCIWLPSFIIKS